MNTSALSPRILRPEGMDPRWRWDKHIPALPLSISSVGSIMTGFGNTDYRGPRRR